MIRHVPFLTVLVFLLWGVSAVAVPPSSESTGGLAPPASPQVRAGQSPVASLDEEDDAWLDTVSPVVADPLEGWNRAMQSFNDGVILYVVRPVVAGYTWAVPEFLRTGIRNMGHNLLFPVRFVNNLLQGKGLAAGVEMSRFVLNSTAGLGGFFDVAKSHKPIVPVDDDEDMGQTLGVWGVGDGFYIVWPFLGPSTLRDSVGMVGDYFLDPLSYSETSPFWYAGISVSATRVLSSLELILDNYDSLKSTAVEPYSSFRDAYIQHRRARMAK